jgi:hypothetical protein
MEARSRSLIQRMPNKAEEFRGLKGFLQYREGSGCLGASSARRARPTGHDDDRHRVAALPEFFKKLKAGHSRHMDIEDQAILVGRLRTFQKCLRRRKIARFEAHAFKEQSQRIPSSAVVVDNVNHLPSPDLIDACSPFWHRSALIQVSSADKDRTAVLFFLVSGRVLVQSIAKTRGKYDPCE